MMRLTILLLVFVSAQLACADEAGVRKYRDYTPKQLADLPETVRHSEVPMMYSQAATNALGVGSETLFGMYLNTLMYPGLHSYEQAVKQFQKDLGDPPNGALTVWQIHNLERRAELQKLSYVAFPHTFFSSIDKDFAHVSGTLALLDERIADPVNNVQVRCYRQEGYCRVEQIYLSFPNDDSWGQSFIVGQYDPEYFRVTKWTEQSIDAEPTNNQACRTTTMNLNFSTKEFFQISRNTDRDCQVLDQKLPRLAKPRIAQIIDGEKIINDEFAGLRKKAFEALSSGFRAKVEALSDDK